MDCDKFFFPVKDSKIPDISDGEYTINPWNKQKGRDIFTV